MLIYLIGFMGVGKTTTGKSLARLLGMNFIDLDDYIASKYRLTIPDFFSKYDEQAFRAAENVALKELSGTNNAVIATGGGTPCFHDNMKLMNRTGHTVFLQMDTDSIIRRLSCSRKNRPLVKGKSGEEIRELVNKLLSEREKFYLQARVIISASENSTERIFKALGFSPIQTRSKKEQKEI
ncbi:MAG: shikimate kinase [Bacteroidales bacterium]|nr:shikimate kinase [Bacteroidales bacterium]